MIDPLFSERRKGTPPAPQPPDEHVCCQAAQNKSKGRESGELPGGSDFTDNKLDSAFFGLPGLT